jgi:hypothetical protein
VRGGAERLQRELDDVAAGSARLAAAGTGEGAAAQIAPTALGATLGEAAAAVAPAAAEVDEEPALEAVEEAASAPVQRSTDQITAQLQAANMAMDGVARDDLERYLVEHYDLPDVAAVLDRAYAAAGH